MLGKIGGRRRSGQQRRRGFDGITDPTDRSLNKLWERVKDRESRHAAVHGVSKSRTRLWDWTTTTAHKSRHGCLCPEIVRLLIIQDRSNSHYQKFSSLLGPPLQWKCFSGGGRGCQSPLNSWKPYLPGHCQDLNLFVPRKTDQSVSLSDSRVSGGIICPIGYTV